MGVGDGASAENGRDDDGIPHLDVRVGSTRVMMGWSGECCEDWKNGRMLGGRQVLYR